jgi:predicted Zn-dependent protease
MQAYFHRIADLLDSRLRGEERYTCQFGCEDSDFVRLNRGRVRQAGNVLERKLTVDLIDGQRHAGGTVTLTGDFEEDEFRTTHLVEELRATLPLLPEDPHFLYNTEPRSSEHIGEDRLGDSRENVAQALALAEGMDLVGIFAAGAIHSGFANSLGQRNWFTSHSYNFDWSLYQEGDKAIKSNNAGFAWDAESFRSKLASASEQLSVLARTPKEIRPGRYPVFLEPAAVREVVDLLGWGGFGLEAHRSKATVFLHMVEGEARLSPKVNLVENTADGVAPNFDGVGFIRPPRVPLIEGGAYSGCLVSARSAKEYGVPTNGASDQEMPASVDMAGGELARAEALDKLGTGIHVSNLWYLNYSDRPACRITGMTRFATFWVEGGRIVAPLKVMRFDESLYRMFGECLMDLTAERDFMLDESTYFGRSTSSARLPGALIDEFTFTL